MTTSISAAFAAAALAIVPTLVFASRGARVRLTTLLAGGAAGCAGAFLSPIGSLSGLLLYQQFHLCRVRVPYLVVYGFSSCVAVAALAAGVAILWLAP